MTINEYSSSKNLIGKRIIGIDPGCKNKVYCVELHPVTRKVVKKFALPSTQYYYVTNLKRKMEKKSLMKKRDNSLSFNDYLENYKEAFDKIWDINNSNNSEDERLNYFVDKLLGDIKNSPVYVAFGSGGDHEIHLKIAKLIKQKIGKENFSYVNEWNTSKVCHRCLQPLAIVEVRQNYNTIDRLLVCCSEASCPIRGLIVNRDSNAAINIAQKVFFDFKCNLTEGVRVTQKVIQY